MTSKPEFVVGQAVFLKERRSSGQLVKISKVGRLWIHLGKWKRFPLGPGKGDPPSWRLDGDYRGGSYDGVVYLSEADFQREQSIGKKWDELERWIRSKYVRPEELTLEDIQAAIRALKIKPEESK